ncbi:MAG: EscS/YscS/HrcS family type III secretion system export apparatus protein [Actinobacteria bacterium]|nr:EscS/YscS/HrcS family type III secretion system export apparatus protein [Actinomycetota bacterium]|tara:strand:+ start:354 stop:623 length:270 start_codon:yes stop_codon:yes gene_type:complete
MSLDVANSILNTAIQVILFASLPSVGMGLVVGLIIAIFQAITQIQEQTLTFVPKMVVVMMVLGATFPWMFRIIVELTFNLWNNIPAYSR